jgi:hypothetical protein
VYRNHPSVQTAAAVNDDYTSRLLHSEGAGTEQVARLTRTKIGTHTRYFYGRPSTPKYPRRIDETRANRQAFCTQSGNPLGQTSMSNLRKAARQCAYCGKPVLKNTTHCPHCREVLPQVRVSSPVISRGNERSQILRGLLYMVLAVVVHYVLKRSGTLNLPFAVPPITLYLTPVMFLGGLGLALYGLMTRVTA